MGQLMNEAAVLGQDQQPRGGPIESPRDEQGPATKRFREQIGDQRRFSIITTAGEPDGLVKHEMLDGGG